MHENYCSRIAPVNTARTMPSNCDTEKIPNYHTKLQNYKSLNVFQNRDLKVLQVLHLLENRDL